MSGSETVAKCNSETVKEHSGRGVAAGEKAGGPAPVAGAPPARV